MSRNHIDLMDFTLHPGGIVHRNLIQAQWKEALAKKFTKEYGNDRSFQTTENYRRNEKVEDKSYATSWLDTRRKLFIRQKSRVKTRINI